MLAVLSAPVILEIFLHSHDLRSYSDQEIWFLLPVQEEVLAVFIIHPVEIPVSTAVALFIFLPVDFPALVAILVILGVFGDFFYGVLHLNHL